jgi:hypothetical protein
VVTDSNRRLTMQYPDDIGVLRTLPGFRHLATEDLEIIAAASTLVDCGPATLLVSASSRHHGIDEPTADPTDDAATLAPAQPAEPTASQRALLRRLMHT